MEEPFNPYAAPSAIEPATELSTHRGTPDESLRRVAAGLSFLRAATVVVLVASMAIFALRTYPFFGWMRRDTWRFLHVGIAWTVVAARGLSLGGTLNCLAAPAETRPRGWVGAAALATMLNIIVSVDALLRVGTSGAWYTRDFLAILAFAAITVFLRKLGGFLGRKNLAQLALVLLILTAALLAVLLVYTAMGGGFTAHVVQHLPVPAPLEWTFYWSLRGLMSLLPLVLDVLYLILLTQLRSTILMGHSPADARSEQHTAPQ